MRVGGPSRAAPKAPARRASRTAPASDDGFDAYVQSAQSVSAPVPVAPVNSVNAVLGAQEVDDATARRRRAVRRADEMLGQLDHIRHALLIGALPLRTLRDLEDMCVRARDEVDDPDLKAALDEIELRAAVELAKWSTVDDAASD